jgi:hypothetical protein
LGGAFGFCFLQQCWLSMLGMMFLLSSLAFWELHCSCISFFYYLFLFLYFLICLWSYVCRCFSIFMVFTFVMAIKLFSWFSFSFRCKDALKVSFFFLVSFRL